METQEASDLAHSLMNEHGLTSWTFAFDNAVSRFGQCNGGIRQITLSKKLTELNDEKHVRDTILHEVAHALVGARVGHSRRWRAKAKAIGCNGERCYTSEIVTPKRKYKGTCPACSREVTRHIRSKVACSVCCREKNQCQFDYKYVFIWKLNA